MKVLFVSSGNSVFGISPITLNQGNSLIRCGVSVTYFPISGKGMLNYLKNIIPLKKHLSVNYYDIIHAHYSKAAIVASFAGSKPLVVSLMGSDLKTAFLYKIAIVILNKISWNHTIVKSDKMRKSLIKANVSIIPNGVDTDAFHSLDKIDCQNKLGWNLKKKHILFAAKPSRPEKNYNLAQQACELLTSEDIELHSLIDVQPLQIPIWMNAADIILLTSLWEGSPNVIKEAMACNRPIVATDVGDIKWLFGDKQGHYLTEFSPEDVAEKIDLALNFSANHSKTNGREQIFKLGLDSVTIAHILMEVYHKCIKQKLV